MLFPVTTPTMGLIFPTNKPSESKRIRSAISVYSVLFFCGRFSGELACKRNSAEWKLLRLKLASTHTETDSKPTMTKMRKWQQFLYRQNPVLYSSLFQQLRPAHKRNRVALSPTRKTFSNLAVRRAGVSSFYSQGTT